MYRLNAVKPMVAGVTYVTNASTKPRNSHRASPKCLLPMINVAEANDISTVAHKRSLAAKATMYTLVVDRSLGFLYTAKQTRMFPVILMMLIARQTLASMIITPKLRFAKSSEDISIQKLNFTALSCPVKRGNGSPAISTVLKVDVLLLQAIRYKNVIWASRSYKPISNGNMWFKQKHSQGSSSKTEIQGQAR